MSRYANNYYSYAPRFTHSTATAQWGQLAAIVGQQQQMAPLSAEDHSPTAQAPAANGNGVKSELAGLFGSYA